MIARRPGTLLAVTVTLVLLALGLAMRWWFGERGNKPDVGASPAEVVDPRLSYPTRYRNVRPEVKYVGDQVCVDCHFEIAQTYREHPMGRAMATTSQATPIERFEKDVFNPFVVSRLHYGIERRDKRMFHREWVADAKGNKVVEIEVEVPFVVGSGARARSYLVEYEGYLFQSPMTWYPQGKRWNLSPSYEVFNQHFSRPVAPGCLFCHCNHADHVPDTVNRYRRPIFHGHAIGCERCHGPGELHVHRHEQREKYEGIDDTIVNPARLEHTLREAVCQQCHLQGEQRVVARGRSDFDYRPGLPLHLFLMDFVDRREESADFKFVGSVEQMIASRCYQASREPKKLGCSSCHDPHWHPTGQDRIAHYRKRCLQCHTETSCRLPVPKRREKTKDDSCMVCHMPPTGSEVNHTSVTDHRIPRRPIAPARAGRARRPIPGPGDLVPFHRDLFTAEDEEVSRNRGLAVIAMLDSRPPETIARQYAEKALPLLEQALKRDRNDWPVVEARGNALWAISRQEEALAAFETVLKEKPISETTLHRAGNLALELNRLDLARSYLERAIRVNPRRWNYHHGLAIISYRQGEWESALRACQETIRLQPSNQATRSLLVQCYLRLGRKDLAEAEYATLRQLTSEQRRDDLRRWWDEQKRRLTPES